MKIIRVNIYLARAGGLHPVLAEVVTDSGLSGIGEAGIAYGHGATAAAGMIKDLPGISASETVVRHQGQGAWLAGVRISRWINGRKGGRPRKKTALK
jgi:hypothetical protein